MSLLILLCFFLPTFCLIECSLRFLIREFGLFCQALERCLELTRLFVFALVQLCLASFSRLCFFSFSNLINLFLFIVFCLSSIFCTSKLAIFFRASLSARRRTARARARAAAGRSPAGTAARSRRPSAGAPSPLTSTTPHRAVRPLEQGRLAHPEHLAHLGEDVGQRPVLGERGAGQAGQRLGLGPGAGRLGGAAGGDVDHRADRRPPRRRKTARTSDLLGGVDDKRAERRGEEPVQQQRAGDRAGQGDPQAAEQCAADDQERAPAAPGRRSRGVADRLRAPARARPAATAPAAVPAAAQTRRPVGSAGRKPRRRDGARPRSSSALLTARRRRRHRGHGSLLGVHRRAGWSAAATARW